MTLKEKIRTIYYDWANMPEFERREKYPNDKRVEDSFIRIFSDTLMRVHEEYLEAHARDAKPWVTITGKDMKRILNEYQENIKKELS